MGRRSIKQNRKRGPRKILCVSMVGHLAEGLPPAKDAVSGEEKGSIGYSAQRIFNGISEYRAFHCLPFHDEHAELGDVP